MAKTVGVQEQVNNAHRLRQEGQRRASFNNGVGGFKVRFLGNFRREYLMMLFTGTTEACTWGTREDGFSRGACATYPEERLIIGSKTKEPIFARPATSDLQYTRGSTIAGTAVKFSAPSVADSRAKFPDCAF
jgi:hypothetical protein